MKTHATDIDWADMGVEPEPAQPEPDDIVYAITVKDCTEAAKELAMYVDGEWTAEQLAGAFKATIEVAIEALIATPGHHLMEQTDSEWSKMFFVQLARYAPKESEPYSGTEDRGHLTRGEIIQNGGDA